MIGPEAAASATRFAVWQRIDRARRAARRSDLHTFAAHAREDVEAFGAALADLLFLHEPRDGSPHCPGCSAGAAVAWPCPVWQVAVRDLVTGGVSGAGQ